MRILCNIVIIILFGTFLCSEEAKADSEVVKVYPSNSLKVVNGDIEDCCEVGDFIYLQAPEQKPVKARVKRILKDDKIIVRPLSPSTEKFRPGMKIELASYSQSYKNQAAEEISDATMRGRRVKMKTGAAVKYGFILDITPGYGAEIQQTLNPYFDLTASYVTTGAKEGRALFLGGDNDYFKADIAMFSLRGFLGQTVYLSGGIGYRQVDEKRGFYSFAGGDESDGEEFYGATSESIVWSFALGNQWTLRNGIFIGGEWVGCCPPAYYALRRTNNRI